MRARLKWGSYGTVNQGDIIDFQMAPDMRNGHFYDPHGCGHYIPMEQVDLIPTPATPEMALSKVFGQPLKTLNVEFYDDRQRPF